MSRNDKSYSDFIAAIEILEDSLKKHRKRKYMYRVVATQLGILLTDKNALLPRLFENIKFHRLHIKPPNKNMESKKKLGKNQYELSLNITLPGFFRVKRNRLEFSDMFNESKAPIKLKYWLIQPLFSKDFRIIDLIKTVRNKEGAHSDPKQGYKLKIANKIFLGEIQIHKLYINEIGKYVLKQSKMLLDN